MQTPGQKTGSCLQKGSPLLREHRPPRPGTPSHPNIPPSLLKFHARPHLSTRDRLSGQLLPTSATRPSRIQGPSRSHRPASKAGIWMVTCLPGCLGEITHRNIWAVRGGGQKRRLSISRHPIHFRGKSTRDRRRKKNAGDNGPLSAHLALSVFSENPAPRTPPFGPCHSTFLICPLIRSGWL